jgi:hypothetical protein
MSITKECPFCENGNVDLHISGVYVETIKCPECDGHGNMAPSQHDLAMSGIMALEEAFADEAYKY